MLGNSVIMWCFIQEQCLSTETKILDNICVLQIVGPQKRACYVITDMLPEFHQCK